MMFISYKVSKCHQVVAYEVKFYWVYFGHMVYFDFYILYLVNSVFMVLTIQCSCWGCPDASVSHRPFSALLTNTGRWQMMWHERMPAADVYLLCRIDLMAPFFTPST